MVAATRLDCVLGLGLADAARAGRGVVARRPPLGVRLAAGRQAADAERASPTWPSSPRPRPRWRSGWPRPSTRCDDPHEAALRRIALPLAKFWVCKRTPGFMVAEALECLGGNGYVEESVLPLLYREAPLNSVWEGSGNVNALDVLRALAREPEALDAWITEVGLARGADARLDRAVDDTLALLGDDRRRWRPAPAGWPAGWPPACRGRCSCASRPPRSPTPSAPRGSARRTTARSARSTAASLRAIVERATPVL